ncbi:MAG: hypothetical protein ABIK73_09190 [candidate division WOR-3 bacterium]
MSQGPLNRPQDVFSSDYIKRVQQEILATVHSFNKEADEKWRQTVEASIELHGLKEKPKDADVTSKSLSNLLAKSIQPQIRVGTIIDAYPFIGLYRVASTTGVYLCKALKHGSSSLIGIGDADTYPAGCVVWFFVVPGSQYGIILGADPQMNSGTYVLHDAINQKYGLSLKKEPSYTYPLFDSLYLADFSSRNPVDSLNAGEFCRVAETGAMMFMDAFTLINRVNEVCGIWMFLLDYLMRIVAHNFQLWTSAVEEEHFSIGNLVVYQKGIAYKLDEHLGKFKWSSQDEVESGKSTRARYDSDGNFLRYKEHFSPLVRGYRRTIIEKTTDNSSKQKKEEEKAVFAEYVSINGHVSIQTTKSFIISKNEEIPVIDRIDLSNFKSNEYPRLSEKPKEEEETFKETDGEEQSITGLKIQKKLEEAASSEVVYHKGTFYIGSSSYPQAAIVINPNGSITLKDKWGSMIRMTHNKIYLDAEAVIVNAFRFVFPIPPVGVWRGEDAIIYLPKRYIPLADLKDHGIDEVKIIKLEDEDKT